MSTHPSIPILTPLNLNTNAGGFKRQSLNNDFAAKLRQVGSQTTRTLQKTANYMAPIVPGAAILSAGLGTMANNLAGDASGNRTGALAMADSSDPMSKMGDMQDNMMSKSMQLLEMQQLVQRRSEEYQMRSNVLKSDHDTKKNSISNMR
jgi:hypothetical protein